MELYIMMGSRERIHRYCAMISNHIAWNTEQFMWHFCDVCTYRVWSDWNRVNGSSWK